MVLEDPQPVSDIGSRRTTRVEDAPQLRTSSAYSSHPGLRPGLEPYANRPGERGDLFWEPSVFAELITTLERRGFPCHVHATGDRGIRTALDAFETARAANGPGDRRHAIVHVECLAPDDITRFAALGVIPVMQPRHCPPEIVADWRANVGPDRRRPPPAVRALPGARAAPSFSPARNVAEMGPPIPGYTPLSRADPHRGGA